MRGERLEVGEGKIRSYEDLVVYQSSYELVLEIYNVTNNFPDQEKRELGRQLRRAAVSIPANIAEGYGRKNSSAEFKHFLRNALGSSNEMKVLLSLAKDLNYLTEEQISLINRYDVLGKQISKLISSWK